MHALPNVAIHVLRRAFSWMVRIAAGVALAFGCVAAFFWVTTPLPSAEAIRVQAAVGNTRIVDRNGALLYDMPNAQGAYRVPVPLEAVPLYLRQATIAVEDQGFYYNPGFEIRGILRALWANLRSGAIVAGGSTITQQVARGELLDPSFARQQSLERKLREIVLAVKLTRQHSKAEILSLYLNSTYYGEAMLGVEATSWRLFGKPARLLDLAECALIAGLPQAPAAYSPHEHPTAAKARQLQVLDAMTQAGFLTPQQAATAAAESLSYVQHPPILRAPHFVQYVLRQLETVVSGETLAVGGWTITTTLDLDIHERAEAILRRRTRELSMPSDGSAGHNVHNGAVVVLDPTSGGIIAMVGSPNYDDNTINGQINAALAPRQPGSAIKPLTYAAAFERGWTPATVVLDVPSAFPTREGRVYEPENYDRVFHGPLLVREALATSSNVAAVRTLDAIGVQSLLEMARRLGITTLGADAEQYGLPLTLGAGEVTLLQLSAAYGAFADAGTFHAPYAVLAVSDIRAQTRDDTTPWQALAEQQPEAVLSPQIAYLITDILADRFSRMRAFGADNALDIGRPAAVKTGTTNQFRDNWAVGYTPSYVVGVWAGNIDGQPMEDVSGVTGAGPIWHDLMIDLHQDLEPTSFVRPEGIVERAICTEGGMLASQDCPHVRDELFIEGTQPSEPDTSHVRLAVDREFGCIASPDDGPERVDERVFWLLPAEAEYWAAMNHVPLPPQTYCDPTAQPVTALDTQPVLLQPSLGALFSINPLLPAEVQRLELRAQAGMAVTELTFVVDGSPIATLVQPPFSTTWQLAPGVHEVHVEVRDLEGMMRQSESTTFTVLDS